MSEDKDKRFFKKRYLTLTFGEDYEEGYEEGLGFSVNKMAEIEEEHYYLSMEMKMHGRALAMSDQLTDNEKQVLSYFCTQFLRTMDGGDIEK